MIIVLELKFRSSVFVCIGVSSSPVEREEDTVAEGWHLAARRSASPPHKATRRERGMLRVS